MKYVIVVLFIALLLFPIYMMFVGSLLDIRGVTRMPPVVWPRNPTLNNYAILMRGAPMLRWASNTVAVAALALSASVITSAMAGYAFATQRGMAWLYWAFMATMMIPRQLLIIPMYVLMRRLGLSGTVLAATLPWFFFPLGIFLFRNYVEGLPRSMLDSARIDGATEMQALWRIIAPLSAPALGTVVILKFIEALTDFLWQMLVFQRVSTQTLIVGLVARATSSGIYFEMRINPIGIQMAAGVVLFLPLLAIFAMFQKSFINGILNGGVRE